MLGVQRRQRTGAPHEQLRVELTRVRVARLVCDGLARVCERGQQPRPIAYSGGTVDSDWLLRLLERASGHGADGRRGPRACALCTRVALHVRARTPAVEGARMTAIRIDGRGERLLARRVILNLPCVKSLLTLSCDGGDCLMVALAVGPVLGV